MRNLVLGVAKCLSVLVRVMNDGVVMLERFIFHFHYR